MEIRPASTGDLEALSALAVETYVAAFGHSMTRADLAAHIQRNLQPETFGQIMIPDTVLVAASGARLLGYCQFGPAVSEVPQAQPGDLELFRLYVHPGFQNRGIGAGLMSAALADPAMRAAGRIFLDVWEHNPGARRFYERFGFEVVGAREFVVESGAETSLDLIMLRQRDVSIE